MGYGLDCSNFASWTYNYGLGIHLSSSVDRLADPNCREEEVISRDDLLSGKKSLQAGDLILLNGMPKHVVIYLGSGKIVDSTSWKEQGVGVTDLGSRHQSRDWRNPFRHPGKLILVRRPIR